MSRIPSLRFPVITLILLAFAAIAVNAYWGGGFGFSLSAAPENGANGQGKEVAGPLVMTTPLNAITSFDAAVISRHIVNAPAFANINQKCAADVSNNGNISSNDSAILSRYVTSVGPPYGLTGTTVNPPCHANYQTTIPIFKGDVSGQDPVSTGGVPGTMGVSMPVISGTPGTVVIPIMIDDTTGMDIESYDLQVSFDPAVVQPAATPYIQTGTRSSAWSITPNASNPGHLIVGGFAFNPLSGPGVLLYLQFNIVGTTGQSTALTFENYTDPAGMAHEGFLFNEATPSVSTTNGSITVGPNTATPTATYTPTFTPTPVDGSVPVSLPNVTGQVGYIVTVPVTIGDLTGLHISSYQFGYSFDPAVLQAMPPETAGTLIDIPDWSISTNQTTGHGNALGYSGGTVYPTGAGTFINLKFLVVGSPGQSTALWFTGPPSTFKMWNGIPNYALVPSWTTNGSLTVIAASQTPTPTNTATSTPVGTPCTVPVPVSLPNVSAVEGSGITIPITIGNTTSLGVCCYDFQVTYDPTVLQPASPPLDKSGTLSETLITGAGTNFSGHLIGGAYRAPPFELYGAGTLIKLKFTVVGTAGQSSALTFENYTDPGNNPHPGFALNEGDPASTTTNGSVTVGASGGAAIAGNVTYGNAIGSPATRFVPTVMVDGAGSTGIWTLTDQASGDYSLFGFGAGAYTVSPSKTDGANGAISSFDAARIAQHVTGAALLTGNPLVVADVSGNGNVSSFDAAQIAGYVANLPGTGGSTGNWRFDPASRTYASVSTVTGEDYSALLMGEVSGNWANSGGRPVGSRNSGPARNIDVTVPSIVASPGTDVIVPVAIQRAAKKGIISYEFDLRYDANVIVPQADPVDLTGTVSRGLSIVTNAKEPGLLRVVVYGPMPINDDGILLNLRFTAVGKPGSTSPLTWERIMFNEGEPRANATGGQVELF